MCMEQNRPIGLAAFLGLLLVAVGAGLHAAAADFTIAAGGKSEYRILTPAEPCGEETFAAAELKRCIRAATGADLAVVKGLDPSTGRFLIVARADSEPAKSLLAREGAPALKDHEEAMLVATVDDDVLLTGRAPHAALYALYDFLENEVGCAWLFPGHLGEEIPKVETLRVGELHRSEAPSFPFRWIGAGEWALRNRMNIRVRAGKLDTGVVQLLGGHSFKKILPPDKYFDEHPEYYAMVSGERRRSRSPRHGDQYCTSNPDVVRLVVENMREVLDAEPRARVISLSPNDGLGFCECPRCMALDPKGPHSLIDAQHGRSVPWEVARGILSRRMLLFYNQVANELAKSHPKVLIKSFAYSLYAAPPKDPNLRCAPNLMIQMCHGVCHNHSLTDPNCEYNRAYRAFLDGWAKIGQHLAIYEYYWKVAWLDLPWPILHTMRKDIPYYHKAGVKLLYTQCARTNSAGGFGLIYYVAARLLWDVNADVDALVETFCRKAYGAGGNAMVAYYRFWEEAMEKGDIHAAANMAEAVLKVFSPENLARARNLLSKAKARADSENARRRIGRVRLQWEWAQLASRYVLALKAVRDRHPSRWAGATDPAMDRDVRSEVTPILAEMRQFLDTHEKDQVVRSRRNNYIARFLRPQAVLSWLDLIGEQGKAQPLPADVWLASAQAPKVARQKALPPRLDLWVYGHDFDTDGVESEHELFLLDAQGKRLPLPGLAPPKDTGNRANRCYVIAGVPTADITKGAARIVITNPAGKWTDSTLFGFFLMPHIDGMTNDKATALIHRHLDWVRANSAGFFEFPRAGQRNRDGAEESVTIPIIGLPVEIAPVPKVAEPKGPQPVARLDEATKAAVLENEAGRLTLAPSSALSAGPLISYGTSQTLITRLGISLDPEKPFEFIGPRCAAVKLETRHGRRWAVGSAEDGKSQLAVSVGNRSEGFSATLTLPAARARRALFFPVIEMPAAICDSVVYPAADGGIREDAAILRAGGRISLGADWFAPRNLAPTDEGVLVLLPRKDLILHVRRAGRGDKTFRFAVDVPQGDAGAVSIRVIPYRGARGYKRLLSERARQP